LHSLRYNLTLVYVDHGTRPETAQESRIVERLAQELDATFVLKTVQPASFSEAAMRSARYEALDSVEGDRLATGHTASDQAETVLMRLLRGTGTVGLSGIPPRRGRIIRPLISQTRTDIMDFLATIEASYCTDPTNKELGPLRNRVRHELLPMLSNGYQANVSERLVDMANALRRDRRFIEDAAAEHLQEHGLNRQALQDAHSDLRPHILRQASPVSIPAERMYAIERLLQGQGGTVQLEGNVVVLLSPKASELQFFDSRAKHLPGDLDAAIKER